ncbi:MAG: hypothetical protein ACJATT_005018 [Myxococcota bacterium]|jgi:hypothetical protein
MANNRDIANSSTAPNFISQDTGLRQSSPISGVSGASNGDCVVICAPP